MWSSARSVRAQLKWSAKQAPNSANGLRNMVSVSYGAAATSEETAGDCNALLAKAAVIATRLSILNTTGRPRRFCRSIGKVRSSEWTHGNMSASGRVTNGSALTAPSMSNSTSWLRRWKRGSTETARIQKFYGPTFRASALSARTNVETIPKGELLSGLKAATSNCQKGEYAKGAHSFLILERLHPARVRAASPLWCERFLRSLRPK